MSEQEMLMLSVKDRDRLKVLHEVKRGQLTQRVEAARTKKTLEIQERIYSLSLARNCQWISFFPLTPRFFFLTKAAIDELGIEKLLAFLYPRAL